MKSHTNLKPRDAIHAGVCLNKNVSTIYSDDPDFDSIPNITRIPLKRKV
jgi:predicted nucleic acid-binding protein